MRFVFWMGTLSMRTFDVNAGNCSPYFFVLFSAVTIIVFLTGEKKNKVSEKPPSVPLREIELVFTCIGGFPVNAGMVADAWVELNTVVGRGSPRNVTTELEVRKFPCTVT